MYSEVVWHLLCTYPSDGSSVQKEPEDDVSKGMVLSAILHVNSEVDAWSRASRGPLSDLLH